MLLKQNMGGRVKGRLEIRVGGGGGLLGGLGGLGRGARQAHEGGRDYHTQIIMWRSIAIGYHLDSRKQLIVDFEARAG